jgi:hypothetical protein
MRNEVCKEQRMLEAEVQEDHGQKTGCSAIDEKWEKITWTCK